MLYFPAQLQFGRERWHEFLSHAQTLQVQERNSISSSCASKLVGYKVPGLVWKCAHGRTYGDFLSIHPRSGSYPFQLNGFIRSVTRQAGP